MTVHYVATVRLTKVTNTALTKGNSYGKEEVVRTKATIANLTVSDESLIVLTTKLNQHLGLLTDGGDIENV